MSRIPASVRVAAVAYAILLVVIVLAARFGLYPGVAEAHPGAPLLAHPYRVSMAATVSVLAILLGVGSGLVGAVLGSRFLGLAALLAGGVMTGLALSLAPWILYPADQYPVSFLWVMVGGPIGLASWGALALLVPGGAGTSEQPA